MKDKADDRARDRGRPTLTIKRPDNSTGQGDEGRKLCIMYLSIMDHMNVKVDRFGDADSRLPGL